MTKRVLNVGQCDFDNYQITQMLTKHFSVEVVCVKSHKEAEAELADANYDLVMVNRINDSDGSEGLKFIETAMGSSQPKPNPPMMLISNFEDAQESAAKLGAVAGFGKSGLQDASTIENLSRYLEA